MPNLPPDHPHRRELNDEVHARPPAALRPPLRISYLAVPCSAAERELSWHKVVELAERHGVEPPQAGTNHWSAALGELRLRWERHTEFVRYTFLLPGVEQQPFERPALDAVPADWLAGLPGRPLVAVHAALVEAPPTTPDIDLLSRAWFGGNVLIGGEVGGGAAVVLTDLRLHQGFTRLWLADRSLTPRQAGRMLQRLLEIETYRMLALLALPVARELGPFLSTSEREIAQITETMADAGEAQEPELLDRLTRLAAAIEHRVSEHAYRFSAATAYYELVQRRIKELRETAIPGMQTFAEFTERRLVPAMNTCRSVWERQEALSRRVGRATQLLSTRVDITHERQNQALLESMNRRAQLQLRLQETVEGLSIAAVTYYIVGLVGYGAKGLQSLGLKLETGLVTAVSIPVVAGLVALGVRRVRRAVAAHEA